MSIILTWKSGGVCGKLVHSRPKIVYFFSEENNNRQDLQSRQSRSKISTLMGLEDLEKCKFCGRPTPKVILEKGKGLCLKCQSMRDKTIKFF